MPLLCCFDVDPLAVRRRFQSIGRQVEDLVSRFGNTFLLKGTKTDINFLAYNMGLIDFAQPSSKRLVGGRQQLSLLCFLCLSCLL